MKLRSGRTISTPVISSADPHCAKSNGSVSLAHFQSEAEQGSVPLPASVRAEARTRQPLVETVYDYIVRRNGIINEVKLHLFQLTLIKNLDEQLIQIDKICSTFTTEFDYLMKYTFEPTKRFIQLIHSKTLEWVNQYPSRRDLLFKLHDMTHI